MPGCGLDGWRSAVCSETKRAWMPWQSRQWFEAAVRLAGRDREQPAVGLQRVEQFERSRRTSGSSTWPSARGALEMRPCRSPPARRARSGSTSGASIAIASSRLRPMTLPTSPPAAGRRGRARRRLSRQGGEDGRPAVDQRPVAIEDRQPCSRVRPCGRWVGHRARRLRLSTRAPLAVARRGGGPGAAARPSAASPRATACGSGSSSGRSRRASDRSRAWPRLSAKWCGQLGGDVDLAAVGMRRSAGGARGGAACG